MATNKDDIELFLKYGWTNAFLVHSKCIGKSSDVFMESTIIFFTNENYTRLQSIKDYYVQNQYQHLYNFLIYSIKEITIEQAKIFLS